MSDYPYIDWPSMTDKSLTETIGRFAKHHRLNQNKTQSDVAKAAGISRSTLSLLERGEKIAPLDASYLLPEHNEIVEGQQAIKNNFDLIKRSFFSHL